MASFSYFVDKLSPETRVLIYGFLFGDCEHVKRISQPAGEADKDEIKDERLSMSGCSEKEEPVILETSVFATSKLISGEAMETFFNSKVVRLSFAQVGQDEDACYLERIRRLEIIDCSQYGSRSGVHKALDIAIKLPRAKSLVVLSDALAHMPKEKAGITVRDWSEKVGLATGLHCIDIRTYGLGRPYNKVMIVNSKVARMWPNVRTTPDDYDVYIEAQMVEDSYRVGGIVGNSFAWAAQTSLRLWVGLYEWCFRHAGKSHEQLKEDGIDDWTRFMFMQSWVHWNKISMRTPGGVGASRVPLHKLDAGCDGASLEWASEMLAFNVETFECQTMDPPFREKAKCCWPEIENGRSIIARQAA